MTEKPNVRKAVPFFMVSDIEASVRYYVEGLGFRKTIEWTPEGRLQWCWLEIGNADLMLQEFRQDRHPARGGALGSGVSVCFICEDAIALYREFTGRGVEARRPFVGNGMWVTSLTDPDGYRIDFESETDAPEESQLPE